MSTILQAQNLKVVQITGEPYNWDDNFGNTNTQYDVQVMDESGELHDAQWSKRANAAEPEVGEVVHARLDDTSNGEYPPKLKTVKQQDGQGGGQRQGGQRRQGGGQKKQGGYDNTGARIGFAFNAGLAHATINAQLEHSAGNTAARVKFDAVLIAAGWYFEQANAVAEKGAAAFERGRPTQGHTGRQVNPAPDMTPPPPSQPRADAPDLEPQGFDEPPPPDDDDIPF